MTDAPTPSGDPPSDPPSDPAAATGVATDGATRDLAGLPGADGAVLADAVDPDPVDLDAIEADLDRVESALQQLADGTYWDRSRAPAGAPSAHDATSPEPSTSA